jgi:hypothetical protein
MEKTKMNTDKYWYCLREFVNSRKNNAEMVAMLSVIRNELIDRVAEMRKSNLQIGKSYFDKLTKIEELLDLFNA